VLGATHREAEEQAYELLSAVELKKFANRYPQSLSGGEQQRVAIVRALAMKPDVLLLDEPTSALDPRRSADLRTLLRHFVENGHTMIIVSHSIKFLEGLADYLLYIEGGETVEFAEASKLLSNPMNPRTREFMQQVH
jgi:ABC-type polar amino acid transport system ATPase subunit